MEGAAAGGGGGAGVAAGAVLVAGVAAGVWAKALAPAARAIKLTIARRMEQRFLNKRSAILLARL
jgi:hypothetical protein